MLGLALRLRSALGHVLAAAMMPAAVVTVVLRIAASPGLSAGEAFYPRHVRKASLPAGMRIAAHAPSGRPGHVDLG